MVRAAQMANGADTDWTYRWTAELANVHILQEVPRFIRVTDIFKGLCRILACRLRRDEEHKIV
jgi:hypothetical protein